MDKECYESIKNYGKEVIQLIDKFLEVETPIDLAKGEELLNCLSEEAEHLHTSIKMKEQFYHEKRNELQNNTYTLSAAEKENLFLLNEKVLKKKKELTSFLKKKYDLASLDAMSKL